MNSIIEKFALWLLGKKYVYKSKHGILAFDKPMSEQTQMLVSEHINKEFNKDALKVALNKTMLDYISKHKGTVEDGKCFLASDEFVLKVNKDGTVVPVVDCNGNKEKVSL
jgi:hypothetical protein